VKKAEEERQHSLSVLLFSLSAQFFTANCVRKSLVPMTVSLLLVGVVFICTPGDTAATQVFGLDGKVLFGSVGSIIALLPGTFFAFITTTYIINAKISFNVPWIAAYVAGVVLAIVYCVGLIAYGKKYAAAEALS